VWKTKSERTELTVVRLGTGKGIPGRGGMPQYVNPLMCAVEPSARILSHPRKAEKISFREKISFQKSESTTGLPTIFL
jgi:hypothetical protein